MNIYCNVRLDPNSCTMYVSCLSYSCVYVCITDHDYGQRNLQVRVCVFVMFAYICKYICVYVHTHTRIHIYIANTTMHMYVGTCIHLMHGYACVYIRMYIHLSIFTWIVVCIHVHMYVCMYVSTLFHTGVPLNGHPE